MSVQITDINWDTADIDPEELGLPSEVIVDYAVEGIADDEEVADWLSDKYGWCVESFSVSDFKNEEGASPKV
jgi:hypothetical protein